MLQDFLFQGEGHFEYVQQKALAAEEEIRAVPRDSLVGAGADDMISKIILKHSISVPVLRPNETVGEAEDVKIDIPATRVGYSFTQASGHPKSTERESPLGYLSMGMAGYLT